MTVHVWRSGGVVARGQVDGAAWRAFLRAVCAEGDRVTVWRDGRPEMYYFDRRSLQRAW